MLVALVIGAAVFYSNQHAGKDSPIDSVAVLPVVANSSDQNAQFLGDGITDSLIDSLSQVPNLKVMSRSSVFHYKGREIDPQAVGRELRVKGVLTGRLVEQGDNLFLSEELVRASDNSHVWGEEYRQKSPTSCPFRQNWREQSRKSSGSGCPANSSRDCSSREHRIQKPTPCTSEAATLRIT